MNLFFINTMKLGWLGVGVATVIFQVVQPIIMLMYLKGTAHGRSNMLDHIGARGIGRTSLSFWYEANIAVSSFSGIVQYLQLALPGILAISEWWASEICIFLAGKLSPDSDTALGSMAIYQSMSSACFMFPLGMTVSGSARIGHHLGSGDIQGARLSAKVCIGSAGLFSIALGSMLYFTPHTLFPSLFSTDDNLIEMTSRIVPLLSIYVVGDGLQVSLNAIIKGCGRQCVSRELSLLFLVHLDVHKRHSSLPASLTGIGTNYYICILVCCTPSCISFSICQVRWDHRLQWTSIILWHCWIGRRYDDGYLDSLHFTWYILCIYDRLALGS